MKHRIGKASYLIGVMMIPVLAQQKPADRPAFEVASIKPGDPMSKQPSLQMAPGGRLNAENVSLKRLIGFAYDLRPVGISGGQAWTDSQTYNVEAKAGSAAAVPSGPAGMARMRAMMQSLLADRFKLVVHREMKEEQVFDLVVAKGGPKLKKAADTLHASDQGLRGGAGLIMGFAAPISLLPGLLSQLLGGPVTDKTELTGKYDFTLKWTPDPSEAQTGAENVPPPDPSGPSIYTAIQEQLGLRLTSTKRQVEVLVIDRAEKASAN